MAGAFVRWDQMADRLGQMFEGSKKHADKEVSERGAFAPVVEYDDGSHAFGLPGLITEPWMAMKRWLGGGGEEQVARMRTGLPFSPEAIGDALTIGGSAALGSVAAPKPQGAYVTSGAGAKPGTPGAVGRLADDLAPNPQHVDQMAAGQPGRMPAHDPLQAQAGHSLTPLDPSLAEIYRAYNLAPDGALSEAVAKAIQNSDEYHYGIRVTPYKMSVGQTAPDSVQWYQDASPTSWGDLDAETRRWLKSQGSDEVDRVKEWGYDPDYPDHGTPLGGASTIGIIDPYKDITPKMVNRGRGYGGYATDGDYVSLVRGIGRGRGLDDGEMIIGNAEVMATAPYMEGVDLFANPKEAAALNSALGAFALSDKPEIK